MKRQISKVQTLPYSLFFISYSLFNSPKQHLGIMESMPSNQVLSTLEPLQFYLGMIMPPQTSLQCNENLP
jgi:hypothetical protein